MGRTAGPPIRRLLTSPAPAQGRRAPSLLPHVSPLNAIWVFQRPVSSTSPCPRHPPYPYPAPGPQWKSPQRGQWVHQLHRTPCPRSSPRLPGASPPILLGAGARGSVAVRLEQFQPVSNLCLDGWRARVAAPSPVGCSWSFLRQERTGWDGWGGTGARPRQDHTDASRHSLQSGCRVASSGFSQSPPSLAEEARPQAALRRVSALVSLAAG